MWFYYLLSAIGVSVGTGALVTYEAQQKQTSAVFATEPDVRAEQSAQVVRSLRRLYQINSTAFPQPSGAQLAFIPDTLLKQAVGPGQRVPTGIRFILDAQGNIFPRIAAIADINQERFIGALGDRQLTKAHDVDGNEINSVVERKPRDLARIPNTNPYIFVNEEGIPIGAAPTWSEAGVPVDETSNIVINVPESSTITNPDYPDSSNGTGGNNGQDASIVAPPDNSDVEESVPTEAGGGAITEMPPQAFDGKKNDPRHSFEKDFLNYCVNVITITESDLESTMYTYDIERKASLTYRDDFDLNLRLGKYTNFLAGPYQTLTNTIKLMKDYLDTLVGLPGYDQALADLQDKEAELESKYKYHPEWKKFSTVEDAKNYYDKIMKQRQEEMPAKVSEEIMLIGEAIEYSATYCETVLDLRETHNNLNIQANSAPKETVEILYDGTQPLVTMDMAEDPDIKDPQTNNMKKVSKWVLSTLGVRTVVEEYPNAPNRNYNDKNPAYNK